ncbi:hypothetical protein [Mesorhizobium sp.]|uniref:hypothetical protein n=1 Tax=Mesorhizobium sp. TaxID=1871066 RepID=UPI0025D781F1|nr:hypothetical protein [Mesorhizobium sp.]
MLKVVVATEPQAHEAYLRHCILEGYDTLTTKPMLLPIKNGTFDGPSVFRRTADLLSLSPATADARHSLLVLGRHHEVYDKSVRAQASHMVDILGTPITSVNLKTAGGVWNVGSEFSTRDDHPYKHGYGMLMHGAYHYVDILARMLLINRRLYPDADFVMKISGYAAFPADQDVRVTDCVTKRLSHHSESMSMLQPGIRYGETDIVTAFSLQFKNTRKVLALGNLALEQTTPGMRSWGPFPEVPYNINGRLHCTDVDVRLGTVFSVNGNVVKVPLGSRKGQNDLRGKNLATITTRANAYVAGTQEFIAEERIARPYGNSFSYAAESELFEAWIEGRKTYSELASHLLGAALISALSEVISENGVETIIDFNFAEPDWPDPQLPACAVCDEDGAMQFAAEGLAVEAIDPQLQALDAKCGLGALSAQLLIAFGDGGVTGRNGRLQKRDPGEEISG